MPAAISFTVFTANDILFLNKAAANAFFSDITVPDALTTAFGAVKMAEALTYAWTTFEYDPNVYVIRINYVDDLGNATYADVPTKETIDEMITNINQLKAILDDLKTKAITAGLLEE